VAFSDFDETGTQQLFLAERDSSHHEQVTRFVDPIQILRIAWAPSSGRVAVVFDVDSDRAGDGSVVFDLGSSLPPRVFEGTVAWWWRDDDALVGGKRDQGLVVLDVTSGESVYTVPHLDYRGGAAIAPYGRPGEVGWFGRNGVFNVFDTFTGELELFEKSIEPLPDMAYWIPIRGNGVQESSCPPR
jgi:hypothetical protein